jgi:hypothetical protein
LDPFITIEKDCQSHWDYIFTKEFSSRAGMIIDREGKTQVGFVVGKKGRRRKFIFANKPKVSDREEMRTDLL